MPARVGHLFPDADRMAVFIAIWGLQVSRERSWLAEPNIQCTQIQHW